MVTPPGNFHAGLKDLLESRHMRAFVAVARRGSFTQGAKDVFLTQSAVSHAIKSMELDVGCALFRRVGKRAILTEAGERLLHYCEEILHKMSDARADLRHLPGGDHETLRIGAPMTVCQHLLPGVLREVQRQFPACRLRVEVGDNPQLLALLLAGRVDLAVMVEPERRPEFTFEPLFRDEVQFVMRPDHPWVNQPRLTPDAIRRETLIIANKATRSHQLVANYFKAAGVRLERCLEFGSVESIKELVKNELGVGVVALWPIQAELNRGELFARPLGPRPLERQWQAVHLREHAPRETDASFIALLRAAGEALVRRTSSGLLRASVAMGWIAGAWSAIASDWLAVTA